MRTVERTATRTGLNVVAFSGGVDSSVVAQLVYSRNPRNTIACIGLSAALPASQLKLAREVAEKIGLPLREVPTAEGENPDYVANRGDSCFHCKTSLYSTLTQVADDAQRGLVAQNKEGAELVLFNGTNADDMRDPTRVGLIAASNFRVASPLGALPKSDVRAIGRGYGLPNWEHAASPCLRSRLAFGVEATDDHLRAVEAAEEAVRAMLMIRDQEDMRVRVLAGERVAIELPPSRVEEANEQIRSFVLAFSDAGLPVGGGVAARAFRSGSVAATSQSGLKAGPGH